MSAYAVRRKQKVMPDNTDPRRASSMSLGIGKACRVPEEHTSAYVSIRQHTSAYVASSMSLGIGKAWRAPHSVSICTFVAVKQVNWVYLERERAD